jgi:hypothetical protein
LSLYRDAPTRLLLIFDTQAGVRKAELPIGGGADDLFYDAKHKCL